MTALTPLARRLRRGQTDVERLLWSKLRNRQIGGWKFRRQMPIDGYIVDFCCPDAWLVVELDGGQHSADERARRDLMRSAALEAHGFLVARFWNREVIENLAGVRETVLNLLQGAPATLSDTELSPSSQPSPPRGEGARRRLSEPAGDPLPPGERSSRGAIG